MVNPTRKFPFSDECPQFFKIYVPRQCSHQLRIPPAFVKQFNGVLPNNFIITSPLKGSWRVDVNKVDDNLYFQKGWHEFVVSNGLQFGDFLIFCYDGNSEFYVKIYGKNGCTKVPSEKTQKTLAVVQENQTFKQTKCIQMRFGDSGNGVNKMTLKPRAPMAIQEPHRDSKEASNFVSAHPFFKVVMTPAYVNHGILNIPSSFYRSYLDKDIKSVFLSMSDKLWPVKVVYATYRVGRLSQGWRSFVKEYTLQVGDVCVFELIERKEIVLKVAIFRCGED